MSKIHPRRTLRRPIAMTLAAGALASNAAAAFIVSNFVGPSGGTWNNAANWSPAGVPNNGANTYHAIIDGQRTATAAVLDMGATIDLLSVTEGDALAINNAQWLAITTSPVVNFGVIDMNSVGNGTDIRIGAPELIFTGDGTLHLSDNIWNVMRNNFGAVTRLRNDVNHTIAGSGQIGLNSLFLTNDGLIEGTQSTVLQLDLRDEETNVNTGIIRANGGSVNIFNSGTVDNSLGVIAAEGNSAMYLNSTTFSGGEFTTAPTGSIFLGTSSPPLLDSILVTGFVRVPNGAAGIFSGVITNNSSISLESIGNGTDFRANSSTVTLAGTGSLAMSDNIWNIVRNNFGPVTRLWQNSTHTIRGSGQLGVNSIFLTNVGLINANQPTVLQLDLREEEENFNNGIMRASDGGTLRIFNSGTLQNASGVIEALAGSSVLLENTTFIGGEITSEGSGAVYANGSPPHLAWVTNTGAFRVPNGLAFAVSDQFTNEATISLESVGNGTDLRVNTTPFMLTGTGELVMSDNIWNIIRNNFGPVTRLTNSATHTIRGAGQIGLNSIFLTNNGLIDATTPTSITMDLREEETNVNDGTLRASGGGTFHLVNSGTLDNTHGVIEAHDASLFIISNSGVTGGELATQDSGVIRLGPSGPPHLYDLTNTGVIRVPNGLAAAWSGTVVNDGTIALDSVGNGTDFRVNSASMTLAGSGELVMSNNIWNVIRNNFGPVTTFVNGADHTVRGAGQIGLNSIGVVNDGTMIADESASIVIDPRDEAGGFVNNGLFHVTGNGAATFSWDGFTNTGVVDVDATRSLTRNGNYLQTGGRTIMDGSLAINSGSLLLQGGVLEGSGVIGGGIVNNSGGNVAPGSSPGTLTLQNGYTQGPGGTLSVELGGPNIGVQSDLLAVTGTATLAGKLNVTLVDDFTPGPGEEITILTANSVVGTFDLIEPCFYNIIYTPTSVKVIVSGGFVLGDLNCDGVVNGADITILLGTWGPCTGCAADLNNDGVVNGADITVLLGNWG